MLHVLMMSVDQQITPLKVKMKKIYVFLVSCHAGCLV